MGVLSLFVSIRLASGLLLFLRGGTFVPLLLLLFLRGAGALYGAGAPAPTPPPPTRLLPEHPAFRPVPRMRGPSAPGPAHHDARRNALQRQAPPSVSAKAWGYGLARRAAAPPGCGRQARPPVPRTEEEILADLRQTARVAVRPPAVLPRRRARIPKPPARSDPRSWGRSSPSSGFIVPTSTKREGCSAEMPSRRIRFTPSEQASRMTSAT